MTVITADRLPWGRCADGTRYLVWGDHYYQLAGALPVVVSYSAGVDGYVEPRAVAVRPTDSAARTWVAADLTTRLNDRSPM